MENFLWAPMVVVSLIGLTVNLAHQKTVVSIHPDSTHTYYWITLVKLRKCRNNYFDVQNLSCLWTQFLDQELIS